MATQVEDIKWLPSNTDRRFMVDGFNFKTPTCQTYFLTHFHSDHTTGLTKRFDLGLVWTSEVTARLLIEDMGLPARCVRVLPLHEPVMMHGCRITLLDANHCPGAVMLLVEVLHDKRGVPVAKPEVILHMGDCRWEDRLAEQLPPGLHVDTLFMDTTYAAPRYTFPPQTVVLDALAVEIAAMLAGQPRSLLVVAAYHIGKEKVYLSLARRLGIKVWCSEAKRRVLHMLGLPSEDLEMLTNRPSDAGLHVSGWGMRPEQLQERFLKAAQEAGLQVDTMAAATASVPANTTAGGVPGLVPVKGEEEEEALLALGEGEVPPQGAYEGAEEEEGAAKACAGQWQHVIGIRATGWSWRKKGKLLSQWVAGPVTIVGAPYSEHSSFNELCSCVRLLRPSRIVPTVNAGTPAASRALVEKFVHLMDLSRQRGRLDMYLRKPGAAIPPVPTPASLVVKREPLARSDSCSMAEPAMFIDLTGETAQARGGTQEHTLQGAIGSTAGGRGTSPAARHADRASRDGRVSGESHGLQVQGAQLAQTSCLQGQGSVRFQEEDRGGQEPSSVQAEGVALLEEEGEAEDEDAHVQARLFGPPAGCMCFAKPTFEDDQPGVERSKDTALGKQLLHEQQEQLADPPDYEQLQQPLQQQEDPPHQQLQTRAAKQHQCQQPLISDALQQRQVPPDFAPGMLGSGADCEIEPGSNGPGSAPDSASGPAAAPNAEECNLSAVDAQEQHRIWELIQREKLRSAAKGNGGARGGPSQGNDSAAAGVPGPSVPTPPRTTASKGAKRGASGRASNGGGNKAVASGDGKSGGKRRRTGSKTVDTEVIVLDGCVESPEGRSLQSRRSGGGAAEVVGGSGTIGGTGAAQRSIRSFFSPGVCSPDAK